jgi:hypothetical protein
MQSSDVMLGSGLNADSGVSLRASGLTRWRMSQLPAACFSWVCA